jgi:threonine synthase
VVNAAGADTFYQLYERNGLRWNGGRFDRPKLDGYMQAMDAADRRADTLASAIEINRPVNLPKALRALERCGGVVREATDQEILDAKAKVGAGGLGCEPASAATVAGLVKLVKDGVIGKDETVACVLTGHVLKDPDATVAYHTADPATFEAKLGKRGVKRASFANRAVQVPNDLAEIIKAIELYA